MGFYRGHGGQGCPSGVYVVGWRSDDGVAGQVALRLACLGLLGVKCHWFMFWRFYVSVKRWSSGVYVVGWRRSDSGQKGRSMDSTH